MTARRGGFSALSKQISEICNDKRRPKQVASVAVATLLSLFAPGCLPDGDYGNARSMDAPVSNKAAKTDRLVASSTPVSQDVRVETTASVIPTSAPDSGANLPAPAPPASAGEALGHFFEALAALDRGDRQEPVTILHLGDQHIAADRITSELRAQFQARFGDAGRGLMAPGVFRVAGAQITRQGNWRVASSAAGAPGPFGSTGVRLTGRDGARLQLTMPEAPFDWAEITFATGPETGKAYVAVDSKGDVISTRTEAETWQRIKINASGQTLAVRAEGSAPVRLLSWRVVRKNAGVRYVSLGVPGATVRTTRAWTPPFFKADLEHLSPDLIILGYGTNSAFDDRLDPNEYLQATEDFIGKLRAAAPGSSILVIGPPDVGQLPAYAANESTDACRPLGGEERADYTALLNAENPRLARWHPPLKLRAVRRALRVAASRAGAYFWDWAEAMGGPCSIHAWVHATPPLAAQDHRNFTAEGARKSARTLFQTLMQAYERYRASAAVAEN